MNSDNIKGNLEKLGGKLKETVGELTGNEKLKSEGKLDQVKGTVRDQAGDLKEKAGDLKEQAGDAVDRLKNKLND